MLGANALWVASQETYPERNADGVEEVCETVTVDTKIPAPRFVFLPPNIRDRANRSGFSLGSSFPAVAGPAFADESSDGDDGVGEGDERVDDGGASLGADVEFLESAVVPGVGAFDNPAGSDLDRRGVSFGCDLVVAAEFVEQVPGVAGVVSGVQVHGDPVGQVVEAGQGLKRRSEQR